MSSSLQVAIIGAGRWGPNLIRNFQLHQECRVTWVCDLDIVRLEAIRRKYRGIRVSADWQAVLCREDVDAVVVCSPTSTHFPIALNALKAGKHVFVEKPLATTVAEAQALVSLADQRKLKLMVGHVFLFNPAVRRMTELIRLGALGEIHYLYAMRTNLGPIRADTNALWDLAPHDISILLELMGESPERVRAFGSSFINPPVEDVVFGALHFAGGKMASLHVSWVDPRKVRRIVVVGSRGMMVFDDMEGDTPLRVFEKTISPDMTRTVINDTIRLFRKSIIEGASHVIPVEHAEPLREECDAFVRWVLHDMPNPSNGKMGLKIVEVLEAMTESMKRQGVPFRMRRPVPRASESRQHEAEV